MLRAGLMVVAAVALAASSSPTQTGRQANTVSLPFTHLDQVTSNVFLADGPDWFWGATQFGGAWTSNGWVVGTSAADDTGALLLDLDRTTLSNNLWLSLDLSGDRAAELYIDLLNTNAIPVAFDLFGNIMEDGATNALLYVPLLDYPDAATIGLRRGIGAVLINQAILTVATNTTTGTTDSGVQTTLPATYTRVDPVIGSQNAGVGGTPTGGDQTMLDGNTNNVTGDNPGASIWYVSAGGGSDTNSGHAATLNGQHGPFATVNKALHAAATGDTIVILEGWYDESADFSGRNLTVVFQGEVDFTHQHVSKK